MSSHSLHHPRWTTAAPSLRHRRAGTASAATTLEPGEHVLANSPRSGHTQVCATDLALHHRPVGGLWQRIAWIDVAAVEWTAGGSLRLVVWSDPSGAEPLMLHTDRTVATLAADRTAHAHVVVRRVRLAAGTSAVVEAVRVGDEQPAWRSHVPPGVDDRAAAEQACQVVIDQLRSLTGC